jgi:hypothetical protein
MYKLPYFYLYVYVYTTNLPTSRCCEMFLNAQNEKNIGISLQLFSLDVERQRNPQDTGVNLNQDSKFRMASCDVSRLQKLYFSDILPVIVDPASE